jgi:hypothetical protein
MKIYNSMESMLNELEKSPVYIEQELQFCESGKFNEEAYNSFNTDLMNTLYQQRVFEEDILLTEILMSELASNAYNASVKKQGDFINLRAYLSETGSVVGTSQNTNFLSDDQINLLKKQQAIPRTTNPFGEDKFKLSGTNFIIKNSEGLLIQDKEIYVMKLY